MEWACERCGERTQGADTASRIFCDECAKSASTGARRSSELLFSLRPGSRESVEDLATLTAARPVGERITLSPFVRLEGMTIAVPKVKSGRLHSYGSWVLLSAALSIFAGSGAFAMRTVTAEREMKLGMQSAPRAVEAVRRSADSARAIRMPSPQREAATCEQSAAPTCAEPIASTERSAEPASEPSRPVPNVTRPGRAPRVQRASSQSEDPFVRDLFAPRPSDAPPAPPLPSLPTRAQVQRAMAALAGRVARCGDGSRLATVRVTFNGNGRATASAVTGANVPADVRGCAERVTREAELPAFSQSRFVVAYPYRM